MPENVAWIGLGNMGRGMSANIAQKGPQENLILYNRTVARATAHAEEIEGKTTVATSLSEAVKNADIIFICVTIDEAVNQIVDEILVSNELDLSSKVFVDCSTVHPDTSRRTEKAFASHGAAFVACPVFGAPMMANNGQLIVVPAGKQSAIARVKPWFDGVTARATIDLSEGTGKDVEVGRAATLKLVGNSFIMNTVGVLAETLVAAEATGLGVGPVQQWLNLFSPGPFCNYATRMTSGEYYKREEPLCSVDVAQKDLRHASSLAKEGGLQMRNVEVTDSYLQLVRAEKGNKGDLAGIYGAARKEAGMKFENE